MDTLLLSIKNYEIILVYLIEEKLRITEICILPDLNILISIEKYDSNADKVEYFYQYKYISKMNENNKKWNIN